MNQMNGNLSDICRAHVEAKKEKCVFTFTKFRPRKQETKLTWEELDGNARAIAQRLQQESSVGDRVLLLFRPGLEFVSSFMACLYAGMVAVPSSVPRAGLSTERLDGIIKDSGVALALSSASVKELVERERQNAEHAPALQWLLFDDIELSEHSMWSKPNLTENSLAFLQYSSGSTGVPKGVMVTHGNLIHQLELLRHSMESNENSRFVSWLPTFHDLGLIAGVLSPIYVGGQGALMSPESFIEKPLRWLQMLSDTAADISAAPNFAYELCAQTLSPDECKALDLSHWRYAMNAAEPIRAATIDSFVSKFAKYGFRRAAMYPAYGLAEATLMVTGGSRSGEPSVRCVDGQQIEQNQVVPLDLNKPHSRVLVGSGIALAAQDIKIVDTETLSELGESKVGEVWVCGPSVAKGYWQRDAESTETFQAATQQAPNQRYLRTGDLGFMLDGELFICGRLKDLILIRGRNLHAPDIELTVESSHPALKPSSGAAFSVEDHNNEALVVVQEIDRKVKLSDEELDAILELIRQNVYQNHEVRASAIVLMRRGIPKTSSGKIQRRKCRAMFLTNQLNACRRWEIFEAKDDAANKREVKSTGRSIGSILDGAHTEVEDWLREALSKALDAPKEAFSSDTVLGELALSRAAQFAFVESAEVRFSQPIAKSAFKDFKTLGDLAAFLGNSNIDAQLFNGLKTEELKFSLDGISKGHNEPIAIVGIGCRFPGAKGLEEFWDMLCEGVDAVREVPSTRWDIDQVYDENPLAVGKMNTRYGGFLDDIELMDRNFFQLSVREAIRMDPQHRLILEVSWEALEDTGMTAEQVSNSSTGVFVGISSSDYAQVQFTDETLTDAYAGLGCALTMAPSRISNFLDLRGPAVAVDTACSSSLSAVHQACISIRQGECEQALAGGVNILLSPMVTMCLTKAGMMSPDGRCKAFDARANGYVRADGAGIVVLKPFSKAIADQDSIYALIKGSASNQDGKGSGIAAPNGEAQQRVVLAACEDAGIEPGELDYVEAHGTGTAVGDPVEVKALGAVVNIGAVTDTQCAIGSVKTNIGHCESAAGVASLIKASMMLKHRKIPPSLHFETPNPQIPFDKLRLQVQTELGVLPKRDRPHYIGVNGFGVGGTNVHIVLEQAPSTATGQSDDAPTMTERPWLLPVSARSVISLKGNALNLANYLRDPANGNLLPAIHHSLTQRRSRLEHSLTVVGKNAAELADALESYANNNYHALARYGYQANHAFAVKRSSPKLAFVFSGQGSQWWKMGRELYQRETLFSKLIDQIDRLLTPHMGWSLIDVLMDDENASLLDQTLYAQPAIFALQLGLVRLYKQWGITPDALVGHSVGEVAAACVSGALSLEDGVVLIAHRAKLMQAATGNGRMASIKISLDALQPYIEDYKHRVCIAAVNSPDAIVLSGEAQALDELLEVLQAKGIVAVPMPVNYAFHSALMEPFKHQLINGIAEIAPRAFDVPMVSTVTGQWCSDDTYLSPSYWGDNMREKVQFAAAIETLIADDYQVFVEVGPHPVLVGAISHTLKTCDAKGGVLQSLQKDSDEQLSLLTTLGELHTLGCQINWPTVSPLVGDIKIPENQPLPRYSWDRQFYWLSSAYQKARKRLSMHPLLTSRLPLAQSAWRCFLDEQSSPFINGLIARERVKLPSGVLLELALAASCSELIGVSLVDLVEISFTGHIDFDRADELPDLQVLALPDAHGRVAIEVQGKPAGVEGKDIGEQPDWRSLFKASTGEQLSAGFAALDIKSLRENSRETFDAGEVYRNLSEKGIDYSTSIQVAKVVWLGDQHVLSKLRLQELKEDSWQSYYLHPLVFEAAEQIGRLCLGYKASFIELHSMQRIRILKRDCDIEYAYAKAWAPVLPNHPLPGIDVMLVNAQGEVGVIVEGVVFKELVDESQKLLKIPSDPMNWLYDIDWQLTPREMTAGQSANFVGTNVWLFFADGSGIAKRMVDAFQSRGHRCIVVTGGDGFERVCDNQFRISVTSVADMQRLFEAIFSDDKSGCNGIIHLWNLDSTSIADTTTVDTLYDSVGLGVVSIVHLIQGIASSGLNISPRLWLVTAGAQPFTGIDPSALEVAQAPVWGLAKTIAMEHPELKCSRVDLSPSPSDKEVQSLCEEIWADGNETQVALRQDQRFLARLVYHKNDEPQLSEGDAGPAASFEQPFDIFATEDEASTEAPKVIPLARRSPRNGEVEVQVTMVGLDPRDGGGAACGNQAVGRVSRVGLGVKALSIGDEVVVVAERCLKSHLIVSEYQVVPLADKLTAQVAVTSCRAYLSALYGIRDLASVKSGDTVFIHGADSERGLAALQIAIWLGAMVVVSAKSSQYKDILLGLGAKYVFDLSEPSLFNCLSQRLGIDGVDVMVNCCAGFDARLFRATLSGFGRCLELLPAYTTATLTQSMFGGGNISLFRIDEGHLISEGKHYANKLLSEVVLHLGDGTFRPLDTKAVTLRQWLDSAAPQDCQLTIALPETDTAGMEFTPIFHSHATYLITGGLGALGLAIAQRMAQSGARQIVLVGRRQPSPEAQSIIEYLNRQGVQCVAMSIDIADKAQVNEMQQRIRDSMSPLRGIIHAAGILENALLVNQDESCIRAVMPAKVNGAWHLHQLTIDDDLDFFVMFSSLASLIGSAGQGNYAGANGFLDGLAEYRKQLGKPGLSIHWGPWADIGMAADAHNQARLEERGMGMLPAEKCMDLLEALIASGQQGAIGAIAMNWILWSKAFPSAGRAPFVADLVPEHQVLSHIGRGKLTAENIALLDAEAQLQEVQVVLHRAVCQSLQLDPDSLDIDIPLSAVGLDSIVALELKNRIESMIDVAVNTLALLKGCSIRDLAKDYREQLLHSSPETETFEASSGNPSKHEEDYAQKLLGEIEDMSDEDVEELLMSIEDDEENANEVTDDY